MLKKMAIFTFLMVIFASFTTCGNAANNRETKNNNGKEVKNMVMKVTAGNHTFTVKLDDNATSRALWDKLPLKLSMANKYGREMVYRFGAGGLPTDNASNQGYKVGDISYWSPMGSLVILYKQNGEIFEQQKIGYTDDDISFFNGMSDIDITFEKQ